MLNRLAFTYTRTGSMQNHLSIYEITVSGQMNYWHMLNLEYNGLICIKAGGISCIYFDINMMCLRWTINDILPRGGLVVFNGYF